MSTIELRVNEKIKVTPVLVISETGENLGQMTTFNALQLARSQGMDLIEVSPNAKPPVCRITNYGKLKYEQDLKERENRKKTRKAEMKEIQLRPVTAEHDLEVKMKAARGFLESGHSVQFRVKFERREAIQFKDRGFAMVNQIIENLKDVSVVKQHASMQGKHMIFILDKNNK